MKSRLCGEAGTSGKHWPAVVIVCILGASGCSKTPTTAPTTVVPPVSSEFQYQLGAFFADSGCTVKRLEYADPNGVVRKADYQAPLWRQTLSLKPGDRMYVRAEVEFRSILAGGIQIDSPEFYDSDMVERVDGPATVVLVVDQVVK
jgi:hypothetical protein